MKPNSPQLSSNSFWQAKWIRSRDGIIGGVCEGLGQRYEVEPWLIRMFWLFSLAFFGIGAVLYLVMMFVVPREDKLRSANRKKILGVCYRISLVLRVDVGLVRTLMVMSAITSFGVVLVAYVVLYFLLPQQQTRPPQYSRCDHSYSS